MILSHVSASQIRLYRDCPRAWAWAYLAGFKAPETPSQRLGKAVHAVLEHYLKTGLVVEVDQNVVAIAKAGFRFLPPRTPELLIEYEMELEVGAGLPKLVGVIDLTEPLVRITDHKTIGDIRYKKSKEVLATDIQLGIYGEWAFRKWPELERIALRHVYYQTKNAPKSAETEVVLTREEVKAIWNGVVETVKEMVETAAKYDDALNITPNFDHCSAYGGCPHLERCGISEVDRAFASFGRSESVKSLEDLLKEKGAGKPAPKKRKEGPAILPPDAPKPTAMMSGSDTLEVSRELASLTPEPAEGETTTTKGIPRFNLFIDCAPTASKGKPPSNVIWFENWIAPIAKEVADENNVIDYRTIKFDGPNFLSAAMRMALHTIPDGCDFVICSMLPSAKHAQEVLVPYAENVYRAVR